MTAEHPPKRAPEVESEDLNAREHLELALEAADDAQARFRIRQALQHLEAREDSRAPIGP